MNQECNAVLDAIRNRRSVRKYTPEAVGREEIGLILEAGRWAPSGLNNQPWRFMVVMQGDGRKEALAKLTKYKRIVESCRALILVFLDLEKSYNPVKDYQGIGACMQNMLLAAHAIGLGGVWLGEIMNNGAKVLETLGLSSEKYEFMAGIALGRPAEKGSSSRKEIGELLLEEFGNQIA